VHDPVAGMGERVRALEVEVSELKDRLDGGLHLLRTLNTTVGDMTRQQRLSREAEAEQYRRMGIRIQVLTLVVAAAAVCVPIAVTLLHIG
jgi:hypothetical protein